MSVKSQKMVKISEVRNGMQELINKHQHNDPGVFQDLERFQKLLNSALKVCDKTKTTRSNINTGLGKPRKINNTFADFMKIFKGETIEYQSRSEVTKTLSEYIKSEQLQINDKKLYFKLNQVLIDILNLDDKIHDIKKIENRMRIKCIENRVKDKSLEAHIKTNLLQTDGSVLVDDTLKSNLNFIVDDLISWRELQKVLYTVFE